MQGIGEFLPGNHIVLLESGREYFPALADCIRLAVTEIYLETYIFEDDATGRFVAAELAAAARRGVAVRVLVDGFGGRPFPDTLMPGLLDAGAQVLIYRPEIGRLRFKRHRLRRLHRKLVVIDGRIGFVGGINIIDDMHTPGHMPPRYDYAVKVEGPLLAPMHATARRLWEIVAWASLRYRLHDPHRPNIRAEPCGDVEAAFLVRDNIAHRRDIEDAYLSALADARSDAMIACAYFLPGRRFRQALRDAAERGVKVVMILQGRVEYRLLHYASRALYGTLLASGVRIIEYHQSFLHAKVAVVDGVWATVGSSNIDPFSLLLAREANVVVRNARFAAQLSASLNQAIARGGREVRHDHWRRRSLLERALIWLAYAGVRLLIGLSGYGGRH
ncbi:MAG TPA: cardiolipin synthase ClsB [Rhodocyclaceae bacterium]|nr:cardiolipin synthase ClsB [Rhodocyclaceae bacterium]